MVRPSNTQTSLFLRTRLAHDSASNLHSVVQVHSIIASAHSSLGATDLELLVVVEEVDWTEVVGLPKKWMVHQLTGELVLVSLATSDWVAALEPFEVAAEVVPFPATVPMVPLAVLKQTEALSMQSFGEPRTSFPECPQDGCAPFRIHH